ncbi:MAG TPA: hypothetical protein VFK41_04650 [Nocardioidaceae bacterium]|nr:hypothetical protein [Nocardioidaceae bacterium]
MSPQVPFDPSQVVWELDQLLGDRPLDSVLGRPVDRSSVRVETEEYHFGSPASGGLVTVHGAWADGGGWSAFVKILQHLRHWALLPMIPPHVAEEMIRFYPWREELQLWRPALVDRLPPGIRVPHLYDTVELGDDRVAVWMEKVDLDPRPWSLNTFSRAARLMGEHNARMCDEEVVAACGVEDDYALRMWAGNGLRPRLSDFDDPARWVHPVLAPYAEVRRRVVAAGSLIEDVLSRLASMRHGMPHGDCSPQNLLVPRGSDEFVMIDISFQAPSPPGTDLAQLVVGLAHAGELAPDQLEEVEKTVLASYAEGFRTTGVDLDDQDLLTAYAGTLLLRSAFTSIPWEWLDDPARKDDLEGRLRLTEFIVDTAERYL